MKRLGFALASLALTTAALAQGLTLPGPGLPHTSGGGGTTPTYVQGNQFQNGASPVTIVPVTLASPVGSGHMVVAIYCAPTGGTDTISFTDDKSNVYTNAFAVPILHAGSGFVCQLGYALNITNSPQTIEASDNTVARTFATIVADEWSNVLATGAVDGTPQGAAQTAPGAGTNGVTTPTVTTTASGDLVYGFSVALGSTGFTFGTGFTGRQNPADHTYYTESLIQTSAGPVAATFTALSGSDSFITITIAFKHS